MMGFKISSHIDKISMMYICYSVAVIAYQTHGYAQVV